MPLEARRVKVEPLPSEEEAKQQRAEGQADLDRRDTMKTSRGTEPSKKNLRGVCSQRRRAVRLSKSEGYGNVTLPGEAEIGSAGTQPIEE